MTRQPTDDLEPTSEPMPQSAAVRGQNEDTYRTLVDQSLQGIVIMQNGRIVFTNPAFSKITGYSHKELLTLPPDKVTGLVHPDHQDRVWGRFRDRLAGAAVPRLYEFKGVRKNGEEAWLQMFASLIKYEGQPAIQGAFADISERKQAEQALHESRERFRELVELLPETVFEMGASGTLTFVNRKAFDHFRYTQEDFDRGLVALEMLAPHERSRAMMNIQRVMLDEPVGLIEYSALRSDGTTFPVLLHSTRIMRDGVPVGLRGFIIDVTDRKRAEQHLELFRNLIDQSNDAIYVIEPTTGQFLDVNHKACFGLGYERDELLSMSAGDVLVDSDGQFDWEKYAEGVRTKSNMISESEIRRKDGTTFPIETSVKHIRQGEQEFLVAVCRDLSERKAIESQLHRALKMEAIGTLAGGIAHDFNNLMTSIKAVSTLLLADLDSDHPHYEPLTDIKIAVERGSKLTTQLLGYARKGKYATRPIDVNRLVTEVVEAFRRTRKELLIRCDLSEDLLAIEADEGQIEQMLLNLLVNAADAMPEGGELAIETSNTSNAQMRGRIHDPRPGRYVSLTIKDTGTGMDEETLEHIFDPFFTTKELGKGTGLGLASVYGTVKGHKGYVDVQSELGAGTTFFIVLPATKRVHEYLDGPADELTEGAGTILLIDDEELVLSHSAAMLRRLGYAALTAEGGFEGIRKFEEHRDAIDLVILDVVMPTVGGEEVFGRIQAVDPNAKVLLASGYAVDERVAEMLRRGCSGFIKKPFGINEISKEIHEILNS